MRILEIEVLATAALLLGHFVVVVRNRFFRTR